MTQRNEESLFPDCASFFNSFPLEGPLGTTHTHITHTHKTYCKMDILVCHSNYNNGCLLGCSGKVSKRL